MRTVFTFIFLSFFVLVSAQNYSFKPTWNVGDFKTVKSKTRTKTYENGKLEQDTTVEHDWTIKVLEDNDDSYLVEIRHENVALSKVMEAFDDLDLELDDFQDLVLVYKVPKDSSDWDLTNWEEVRDFVGGNIQNLIDAIVDEEEDMEETLTMIFSPIMEMFNSKKNMEAMMGDQINFLSIPYRRTFEFQKTYAVTEEEDNPFQPGQKIAAMEKLTLEKANKSNQTYEFSQEVILDLSQFNQMMKSMMKSMAESMGVDEESANKKTAELDDMGMDMTNKRTVLYDKNSGWVKQSTVNATVTVSMPQKGDSKTEVTTVTTVN